MTANDQTTLQTLLGEIPKEEFIQEHFHRLPFARQGGAGWACRLGTWDTLHQILCRQHVDVMVVRDGQQSAGPDPTTGAAAQRLASQGYTILIRHAERHHPQLAALATDFQHDLSAPVNIHIYATPPGKHGFSWHYDAEDVFIIQTSGRKEYSLRKNTVNPWPLLETIPADMGYQREITPLMQVLLVAGDWLYIPCGYWHQATASDTGRTAISLALGVMSPAAIDVYDYLRTQLLDSLLWRQRLPVRQAASAKTAAERAARYGELLSQLADDLASTLRDPRFADNFLERRGSQGSERQRG